MDLKTFNKRTRVIGILNVTPDSFSDGGLLTDKKTLLIQVETMVSQGVDILDIGGESTRPSADSVDLKKELRRVIPAIKTIRKHFSTPVSVDTTKAEVAEQALAAGANLINDISGLRFDPDMVQVALKYNVPVIIMHMQGTPRTMQQNPEYKDVLSDISAMLLKQIKWAESQGIKKDKIIIDPGIGFGKSLEHNLTILKNIPYFKKLEKPVLIGHSRKSFIQKLLGIKNPKDRDEASAIISALSAAKGASLIRTHDVTRTVQAIKLSESLTGCQISGG